MTPTLIALLPEPRPASPTVNPASPFPPQGFLEWSPLFYGFYPPRWSLAVAYLCSTFAIGLLSLVLILHRSVTPPHTQTPDPGRSSRGRSPFPGIPSLTLWSLSELKSIFKMLYKGSGSGVKMGSFTLLLLRVW